MEKGDVDLAAFLKTRHNDMHPSFIKYYWKSLLRCVRGIHEKRIAHGNLEPANFLLVKGAVKLIDFKIATVIPKHLPGTTKEEQKGNVSYMPPEVLQGRRVDGKLMVFAVDLVLKISLKTDVWSLGCILYSMVYGRLPFTMKSKRAKIAAICSTDFEIDFPDCEDYLLVDVLKAVFFIISVHES
ncbi:hypothetical protein OSTOST_01237 [Ostertagia ostertagi]